MSSEFDRGREAERAAILALFELDILWRTANTPQEVVERLKSLVETRQWQLNTNPDLTEI